MYFRRQIAIGDVIHAIKNTPLVKIYSSVSNILCPTIDTNWSLSKRHLIVIVTIHGVIFTLECIFVNKEF